MTNAEKYLKDNVSVEEFIDNFYKFYGGIREGATCRALEEFLKQQVKPTLTEDERVILRNIDKNYEYIVREEGDIVVYEHMREDSSYCCLPCNKNVFQFIKERRRIFY